MSAQDRPLPAGKLPAALLAELLAALPTHDPTLLVGPAVGEDAALIDFIASQPSPQQGASDRLLVAKSDPITFATDEIGFYAVNVCANDLAVTGATPRFYLPTLLLPAGATTEAAVRRIFAQIGAACRDLGIVVAGGHSEITHAVTQPVVAGTMLGEVMRGAAVSSGGCRPGDVILIAGGVPVEGASLIAREKRDALLARGWAAERLDRAANYLYDPGISVLIPARLATQSGQVSAMHDPTEGGIITGLRELAHASGVGLEIDLGAIPMPQLARDLCAEFGLNPLGTIASGALLATAAPEAARALLDAWRAAGWPGAIIGRATHTGLVAYRRGKQVDIPFFASDEITKLWNETT